MPSYRLYALSDTRRHFVGFPKIIDCEDDAAAVEQARTIADRHAIELWEGGRRLGIIAAPGGMLT